MKKYIKAKELLETKANNKEKKPIYATRKLSIGLVSCMLGLVMAAPVIHAEDSVEGPQPQTEQTETQTPAGKAETADKKEGLETKESPVTIENDNPAQVDNEDGFEIGPERVGDRVTAAVKEPTVNPVLYDATTISGGNLVKAKVKVGKKNVNVIATVHVTLKGEDGTIKATLKVTPTRGTTWKVDLPEGVKVAKGDTVTVYQQIGEDKSTEVTANAQPSKASTVTPTMPSGEIWIEQTSSNQVNADEQAEAVEMFNKANTTIAGDIKSVEFSINTAEHAYYEVTYTDGSTSGKIEAPDLKIKQVTETSRSPEIDSITIVDNVVKGKLAGPGPFDKIKVKFIINVNKDKAGQFCNENKCTVDKDSSKPIEVSVNDDGTFSYTLKEGESLTLDQIVGVSIKEPHKFVSCSTTTVKPAKVEKTEVKDPRKLTAEDKKAIDAAIRKAYTVNGVSKLPDGYPETDWEGIPAVIQIDDSGNVKIYSANDVEVTYGSDYSVIPKKNEDGSYKVKDGAEPKITIQPKDLLKNIKPDAPTVALSEDKKSITITPNKVDTDANSISVSYTGKDGSSKTTKATKADDGTWSISEGEGSVDANGVITLPKDKVKGGTTVSATVTDKGGIADDDKTELESDQGKLTVEETIADKVEALGGLDPVVLKKWVGDKLDWKDGVKAKESASDDNKAKIKKFLDEAKTTFTDDTRNTQAEGDFTGTIKVTFDDGSFIEVKNQKLYVSNHVTSMERKDKVPTDALDVEFKLGEGTKVDNTGSGAIEGNKDNPTSYSKYKVKPDTNLKEYKLPAINTSAVDSIKVTPQDGYADPEWKGQDANKPVDFVATENNKVFTAIATKEFKVTFNGNTGTGSMDSATVKKGEKYKLPANGFGTPPDKKEFKTWEIDGKEVAPGTEIEINKDTEVKAIWKDIEYKVSFNGNNGTGSMDSATVKKGEKYKLPANGFGTPPDKKEFKTWEIDGKEVAPGTEIEINKDTEVKAIWKDNPSSPTPTPTPSSKTEYKVTFVGNGAEGSMNKATVEEGKTYTLPGNGFEVPEGKEFTGWKIGGEDKKPGDIITVTDNITVVAQWKDKEKEKPQPEKPGDKEPGKEKDKNEEGKKPGVEDRLKINYDPNGGHWSDKSTDILTYYYDKGNIITLINPPTREGYRFLYWKGSAYQPGDKYTVVEDHMFVAQWEKIEDKKVERKTNPRENVKTGVESVAGVVCTLVASTGALYIGRKKED
ncbi:InlB B-repeat-containing protein [uncultured Anaerococcus sp.]|uniref:InlB B-repeat-containing protein n=1 Tax=uncultured Anaerococcus sp. TaxID=293428 RepID=UPI00288B6D33|nr:InlB B-repeat-containing protein [uncultured Anaerococcus sp.]